MPRSIRSPPATSWNCPIGTVWVASRAKLGRLPPSALGISGSTTRECTETVITEVPWWQSPGYGVQVTRTSGVTPCTPWSSRATRAAVAGPDQPGRVVGRQRIGPRGRPGGCRDAERAALHLEDRHHDPEHRQDQQDPEPRHLDQRTPPLVATPSSRLFLDRVARDVERDGRAAEPQRRHHDVDGHLDRRCAVDRHLAGGHAVGVAAGEGAARSGCGCGPRRRRGRGRGSRRTARPRTRRRPGCCGRTAPAPPAGPRGTPGRADEHQHEVDDRGAALVAPAAATRRQRARC